MMIISYYFTITVGVRGLEGQLPRKHFFEYTTLFKQQIPNDSGKTNYTTWQD